MPLRQCLKGVRVLDLTNNLPGPFASQILGDFGADIIKIESLQGDPVRGYPPFIDSQSMLFLLLNRNKRSFSVDLKTEEGLSIFYQLVKTSDIVLEGFRPGTAKRLRIDFDTLKTIKQDIIYCSLVGYDLQDTRPGHDLNFVGETGILHITGPKESPTPIGVPIGDIGGGSLPAIISILGALLNRKGKAQLINVKITEHLIPWLSIAVANYLAGGEQPQREEHVLSGYNTFYRLYKTKDNLYVSFAPIEGKFWQNFCKAIEREDLLGKQFDFDICENVLPEIFTQKTRSEWTHWFSKNDVPGAPVLTIRESFEKKSRLQEMNQQSGEKVSLISSPFLDQSNKVIIKPPPFLGQHTEEILKEINHLKNLNILKQNKIVGIMD